MDRKTYKTSGGRVVDMEKLIAKNGDTRAVGNMGVNARGDVIDSKNSPIVARNKQINKVYRKQSGNRVKDIPVVDSKKSAKPIIDEAPNVLAEIDAPVSVVAEAEAEEIKEEPVPEPVADISTPVGGLAEAIAKARKEIKQQTAPSPREEERGGDGVTKI